MKLTHAMKWLVIDSVCLTSCSFEPQSEPSGASAQPSGIAVPDLSGSRLDAAQADLEGLGLRSDTVGGGLFGVIDPENWEVCATDPAGEATVKRGRTIHLLVDRPGAC